MKKILATLLVATMLMSCVAFVSFAAVPSIYTATAYGDADFYTPDMNNGGLINSLATLVKTNYESYYTEIFGTSGGKAIRNASPLYKALYYVDSYSNNYDDISGLNDYLTSNSAAIPTAVSTKDLVVLPIYSSGLLYGTNLDLKYDKSIFSLQKVVVQNAKIFDTNDTYSDKTTVAASHDDGVEGLLGLLVFKVLETGIGDDASGNATETFVLSLTDGKPTEGPDGVGGMGSATTMTINVSGLQPKQEEDKEDTVIAQEDVNAMTAAATERVTIAENSNLEDILGDKVQSLNGDTDISKATAYKAVFATINLTDKITEGVEFGFVLRDKNGVGADRFFKATAQFGGQYGVAFFGTPEVLGWYEAIPAVKVNGQLLLNTSEKEAL